MSHFDVRRTYTKILRSDLHARARLDGSINLWQHTPHGWEVIGVYLTFTAAQKAAELQGIRA